MVGEKKSWWIHEMARDLCWGTGEEIRHAWMEILARRIKSIYFPLKLPLPAPRFQLSKRVSCAAHQVLDRL